MALIQSGAGSDLLTIHPVSKAARALLYDASGNVISKAHGVDRASSDHAHPISSVNDATWRHVRSDRTGGLAVALHNSLLSETFEGSSAPSSRWSNSASTWAANTYSSLTGSLFNSGASTAAGSSGSVSLRWFEKRQRVPLHFKARAKIAWASLLLAELGFGNSSGVASPTIGAYWQVTAAGVVQGVLTFNGVDQTTSPVTMPGGWTSNYYSWDVIVDDDSVLFTIQDSTTGLLTAERRIQMAASQSRVWNSSRVPVYARLQATGAISPAPSMNVTAVDVIALDAAMNKPWGHTLAHNGQGSQSSPTAFTLTPNYANSAAPASATLSNTAAGYTTLGGQFQFAAVAGAETDYALFGFQAPSPFSLLVTGIDIDAYNMGAAVATTPTLLQWGCANDLSAVSLATTGFRQVLGAQSLAVGAAIGATADRTISRDFSASPLVTNAGRFFVIALKMPVGTATASQIIRGTVTVKGYFE